MNLLVCTPGRLLQHMDETPMFDCVSLKVLVLDEADRILDLGFRETLAAILENLPKKGTADVAVQRDADEEREGPGEAEHAGPRVLSCSRGERARDAAEASTDGGDV